jgi:capsid protein
LRGIAVGLGVSYHLLASDLSDVNYSSARFGALTDHEFYKSVQSLIVQIFTKRLYREWLKIQLATNNLGLNIPIAKFSKFAVARYTPKSFASIDPAKDANADKLDYEMNLTSLSELAEKRGKTLVDILRQRKKDNELLKEYGITEQQAIEAIKKAA